MSGVLLGSVGASCIQPSMFLVGASAGVYSLIAAHLGKYSIIGFLDIGKQTSKISIVFFFDISIYYNWYVSDLNMVILICFKCLTIIMQ